MSHIQASIQIERPVSDVFAYAADIGNMAAWSGEVVEAAQISEGPMAVGTQFRGVGKFLGRRMETIVEVTALEPDAKFAFKTVSGPVKSENSLTFESVGGGTKVTEAIDAELGGVFGFADPLVARMLGRQFDTNLANMKDLVEAQPNGDT